MLKKRWSDADKWVADCWTCSLESWERQNHLDSINRKSKRTKQQEVRRKELEKYIPELLKGPDADLPIDLLLNMAMASQGRFSDIHGDTALKCIMDYLVVDQPTAERALASCAAVFRSPLQKTWKQVLKTHSSGKIWVIMDLYLLGARQTTNVEISRWDADLARTMTAFYLVGGDQKEDVWILTVIEHQLAAVVEVLTSYISSQIQGEARWDNARFFFTTFQGGDQLISSLFSNLSQKILTTNPDYQLSVLRDYLLPAGIRSLDEMLLQQFTIDRLNGPISSVRLHALYLLLGALLLEESVDDRILSFVSKNKEQALVFAELLSDEIFASVPELLHTAIIEKLVARLASLCSPSDRMARIDNQSSDAVHRLINIISKRDDPATGDAFERLRRKKLKDWVFWIDAAYVEHRDRRRSSGFRFADVNGVSNVLMNAAPATSLDLGTILVDQLSEIAKEIRFSDANELNLFWRKVGKTVQSKIENDCRDIFLAKLRPMMAAYGIQIEKESHAANEKRADLQASTLINTQRIIVPIEVKKDNHPELWSAWEHQLHKQYLTNPYSGGIGIYLILWFGMSKIVSPRGHRITSAEQMASEFSQLIPPPYHGQLLGLVVDLSPRSN